MHLQVAVVGKDNVRNRRESFIFSLFRKLASVKLNDVRERGGKTTKENAKRNGNNYSSQRKQSSRI